MKIVNHFFDLSLNQLVYEVSGVNKKKVYNEKDFIKQFGLKVLLEYKKNIKFENIQMINNNFMKKYEMIYNKKKEKEKENIKEQIDDFDFGETKYKKRKYIDEENIERNIKPFEKKIKNSEKEIINYNEKKKILEDDYFGIRINGLPKSTTGIDIENTFSKYGKIIDIRLIFDKKNNCHKGFK
jgi:RNA recognition motif-containing protein